METREENILAVIKIYSARIWFILGIFALLLVLFGSFFESPWVWLSDKTVGMIGVIGSLLLSGLFVGNIVRIIIAPAYTLKIIQSNVLSIENKKKLEQPILVDMSKSKVFIARKRLRHFKEARMTGENYRIILTTETQRFLFDWILSEYEFQHFFEKNKKTPGNFIIDFFQKAGISQKNTFYYHNKISDII